jgi:hypothetical protein
MRDDLIDRVIDDVARELTAGEPDASFRARVVARIGSSRPASAWRGWWIAVPLAAAIAVAIAIALSTSRERTNDLTPTVARDNAAVPAATPGTRPPNETNDARGYTPSEPAGHPPARDRVSNRSEVAALAPPPLVVPSIDVAPIDRASSIELHELAPIERLDLAPLEPETEPKTQNQNPER